MNKSFAIIIFSLVFISLTLTPGLLVMVDKYHDISIIIDTNEENQKNGEEKDNYFEIEQFMENTVTNSNDKINSLEILYDYSVNYNSLFKELISPPPEYLF